MEGLTESCKIKGPVRVGACNQLHPIPKNSNVIPATNSSEEFVAVIFCVIFTEYDMLG